LPIGLQCWCAAFHAMSIMSKPDDRKAFNTERSRVLLRPTFRDTECQKDPAFDTNHCMSCQSGCGMHDTHWNSIADSQATCFDVRLRVFVITVLGCGTTRSTTISVGSVCSTTTPWTGASGANSRAIYSSLH